MQGNDSQNPKVGTNKVEVDSPYPRLEKNILKEIWTDEEILEKYVHLMDTCITGRQKKKMSKT